jgi:DNA-binding XRE family transcriptional regulator
MMASKKTTKTKKPAPAAPAGDAPPAAVVGDVELDPADPMRSLRERLGLPQAEIARRRHVAPQSVVSNEDAKDRVSVATLRRAMRALGGRLVLVFRRT